jgi:hypothetical protein
VIARRAGIVLDGASSSLYEESTLGLDAKSTRPKQLDTVDDEFHKLSVTLDVSLISVSPSTEQLKLGLRESHWKSLTEVRLVCATPNDAGEYSAPINSQGSLASQERMIALYHPE